MATSKRGRSASAAVVDEREGNVEDEPNGGGDSDGEPEASISKAAQKPKRPPPKHTTTSRTTNDEKAAGRTDTRKRAASVEDEDMPPSKRKLNDRERRMQDQIVALQARLKDAETLFKKVQSDYETLLDFRVTKPEKALEKGDAREAARVQALQEQISAQADEIEELRKRRKSAFKLELAKLAAAAQDGSDVIQMEIDDEDNDDASVDGPEDASTSTQPRRRSSGSGSRSSANVQQLQAERDLANEKYNAIVIERNDLVVERDNLIAQVSGDSRQRKELRKSYAAQLADVQAELKKQFEAEKKQASAESGELAARCKQLEKELDFEIQQSKKLQQAQNTQAASRSNGTTAIAAPVPATTTSMAAEDKELVELLCDLVGLTLNRRPVNGDKTYHFCISDLRARRTLFFKLLVDHDEEQVDFVPDLVPGRDDEVIEALETAIRGHIKFEYKMLQTFFKRLWRCINGRSDGRSQSREPT